MRKKLPRDRLIAFFRALPQTVAALEACGASHHWARVLGAIGPTVKLIAPQLGNAIRGHAAEFGQVVAKEASHVADLLAQVQADTTVPAVAQSASAGLAADHAHVEAQLDAVDAELRAGHTTSAVAQRLTQIPGVGLVVSSMLVMKTPSPQTFRSGRDFAAWLGLTPKDPLDRGQNPAWPHHPGRRRDPAKPAGRRRHRRHLANHLGQRPHRRTNRPDTWTQPTRCHYLHPNPCKQRAVL